MPSADSATPDRTRPNLAPMALAMAPSVSVRSPISQAMDPSRSASRRADGSLGLPANSAFCPVAYSTLATIEPPPGTSPSAVG